MTESQQIENQLRESSEFMRTLFESAPDAIVVVDEKGEMFRINAQTESMFGYDRDELIGSPLEILIPERYRQKHVGLRNSYFSEPTTRSMGAGLTLSGMRKNGDEFPVDIMLSPLRLSQGNMVIAVLRDITERKEAEKKLRRTEEKFQLLVSGVRDYAIFMLDLKGNVASWNEGAERIKGYKAEEIVGRHFSCFYIDEDIHSDKPSRELEEAIASGRCEDEGLRKRKDGSTFWADVIISAVKDETGKIIGFSKVTRDITVRKQAEEAMDKLMRQREDFVATLTHDLKTPIIAANGAIKLLLEGDFGALSDEQVTVLETIFQSNEAMYRLVATLLDVYRYDSGAKEIMIAYHDLAKAIGKLVQELAPIALSQGITMTTDFPRTPGLVPCDAVEIRRVVQNLLDNGLKFTKSGGKVEVKMEQGSDVTTITVRDSGKGISEEEKPKLFQRFWAPAASGRNYASTGLGLYLCRKIIESHGGQIWCQSTLGSGSTFSFTIPNQLQ